MKTYRDFVNEKKNKVTRVDPEEGSAENDQVYWISDATMALTSVAMRIAQNGGFTSQEEFNNKFKDLSKGDDEEFIASVENPLEKISSAIDYMMNVSSSEWERNGKSVKPLGAAKKMKTGLRKASDAATLIKSGINEVDEPEAHPVGKSFMEKTNNTVNRFFKALGGAFDEDVPSTLEDDAYTYLVTLKARCTNLGLLMRQVSRSEDLKEEKRDKVADLMTTLDGIVGMVDGRIKSLEKGVDTPKIRSGYKRQYDEFKEVKDEFFNEFGQFIKQNAKHERVMSLIDEADNDVDTALEIINSDEQGKKMFKGIEYKPGEKSEYDKAAEYAISKTMDELKRRESGGSSEKSETDAEDDTNKKTIEIDKKLRKVLDDAVDVGEIKVELDKLKKMLIEIQK